MSLQPLRIAVVGGGIAGLCFTLGVLRWKNLGANVEIHVYEAASKFEEIGAGLKFGPNAFKALRLLGLDSALEVSAGTDFEDEDLWFRCRIAQAGHLSKGEVFAEIRYPGSAKGGLRRADFLDQLVKRLPEGHSTFSCRCTSYTVHAQGVTICFQDGSTAEADILIGADGIKSAVRSCLYERKKLSTSEQEAIYSEWVAWRGIVTADDFEAAMGKGALKVGMNFADYRHLIHYPIQHGRLINVVGFVRDQKRIKLGDHDGPWNERRPVEELAEDFRNCDEKFQSLMRSIKAPSIWGIFELPEIEQWIDDRVVLIGDAAHAMTPHQGAGAGQATEDALFLSALLSSRATIEAAKRGSAIQHALSVYMKYRYDRAMKVKKTSQEAGELYELHGVDGEGDDCDKIAKSLRQRWLWIWDYDVEGQLAATLEELERGIDGKMI